MKADYMQRKMPECLLIYLNPDILDSMNFYPIETPE